MTKTIAGNILFSFLAFLGLKTLYEQKMKTTTLFISILVSLVFFSNWNVNAVPHFHEMPFDSRISIDTTTIDAFLIAYPAFKPYKMAVKQLYKKHDHYIWYSDKKLIPLAQMLFNLAENIGSEGILQEMPYRKNFEAIINGQPHNSPSAETELLLSCLYFFYIKNVFQGFDVKQIRENNWYLPSEKIAYVSWLDTLAVDPQLLTREKPEIFTQYYNLRKALYKFSEIEKKGGWKTVNMPPNLKSLKPGDTAATIAQVRSRLFSEGFLIKDTYCPDFDSELLSGLLQFQIRYNRNIDSLITPKLIAELNVPISQRMHTIAVNMERCRWITPVVSSSEEYIAVNIPSYRLHYFRDGKTILVSRVVVGQELHKTIVFSGMLSYIVFRPYWNVPKSILDKEIKPGILKNANYLKNHNMEWADGQVRQKPGKNNALGLVKFMFPNTNNIYLHDSPAKSLFSKEGCAFSHGCIRVEKAKDLAIAITEKDSQWPSQKVDEIMNGNTTKTYILRKKIPVYIGYFTAWADAEGNVAFYNDIYRRDDQLLKLLQHND